MLFNIKVLFKSNNSIAPQNEQAEEKKNEGNGSRKGAEHTSYPHTQELFFIFVCGVSTRFALFWSVFDQPTTPELL
jgi:hypothetical protein